MCFKSKFDKLTREDIVDAICKLEKESAEIDESIIAKQKQIDELTLRGRKETERSARDVSYVQHTSAEQA